MGILILLYITTTAALHCDKIFNYYDSYGNGFDIICQGITSEYIHILRNITVSQEISLTIENSTITNADSGLFHQISHIKYLFIYNSVFTFPMDEQIFQYLNSLEYLEIRNTFFHITKHTFVGLDVLKSLLMSNNDLTKIDEGSFKHIPNLKKFEITSNRIEYINDLPLCEINNLESLNVSGNGITSLKSPSFHCKRSENFHINSQSFTLGIPANEFQSISSYNMALTHLDLSFNKIHEIYNTLTNLKFIKILRLQGNALEQLDNSDFATLGDLEEIYLENNNLKIIEETLFNDKSYLQHIDISFNNLMKFTLGEVPLLDYLNLAHNKLTNFSITGTNAMKSVRILILNSNKFTSFGAHFFHWYSSLELLDLGDNRVELNDQSFNGLVALRVLNLSNNGIEELPRNVFGGLAQLQTLDLSFNKISSLTFNKTFKYLRNLETLNISNNDLAVLNYDIFEPLGNLRVLDISGNKLKEIQYELILSNLKFLSVLDIKSNLLSCDILYTIIQYLKRKNVTYTLVEKINYERENIAGIPCTSERSVVDVVSISNKTPKILVNICITISIMIVLVLLGVLMFRIYIYMKRRKYRPDEFELINE